MRIIQLFGLVGAIAVGAWATRAHNKFAEQWELQRDDSNAKAFGPFDSALGREMPNNLNLPTEPVGPSEGLQSLEDLKRRKAPGGSSSMQSNPYLK